MIQPPMNDEAPDYLAEIAQISQLVDSSKELLAQGNAIDLSNLEAVIGDLCRRMAEVPPANPQEVTAAIEKVVSDLTQLGDALRHQSEPKH
jgi:hypothetical protein